MRVRPFVYFLFLSSMAFAQLIKPPTPSPAAGGMGYLSIFSCLFSNLTTGGAGLSSLVVFFMVGKWMHSKFTEEGDAEKSDAFPALISLTIVLSTTHLDLAMLLLVGGVTFATYDLALILGTTLLAAFALNGGLCNPNAVLIVVPLLIAVMWAQKYAKEESKIAAWVNIIAVSFVISQILTTPSIVQDPVLMASFLVLTILASFIVTKICVYISAARLSGGDMGLLKGIFKKGALKGILGGAKGPGSKPPEPPKGDKGGIGEGAEKKGEAGIATGEGELGKEEQAATLRTGEFVEVGAASLDTAKREEGEVLEEAEQAGLVLRDVCASTKGILNELHNEKLTLPQVDECVRGWLFKTDAELLSRLNALVDKGLHSSGASRIKSRMNRFNHEKNRILEYILIEETRIQKTEKALSSREHAQYNRLDSLLSEKYSQLKKAEARLAGSKGLAAIKGMGNSFAGAFSKGKGKPVFNVEATQQQIKALSVSIEGIKSQYATLKKAKSEVEAAKKKIDDWEIKIKKAIKWAVADVKAIRQLEAVADSLQRELDRQLAADISKQHGMQKDLLSVMRGEYERAEQEGAERLPEEFAVDIMLGLSKFFASLRGILQILNKVDSVTYPAYLDASKQQVTRVMYLISRNTFIDQAGEAHAAAWKDLNAMISAAIEGKTSEFPFNPGDFESKMGSYYTGISKIYKDNEMLNTVEKNAVEGQLAAIEGMRADAARHVQAIAQMGGVLNNEEQSFLTDMKSVLSQVFAKKGKVFTDLEQRSSAFNAKVSKEQGVVRKFWKLRGKARDAFKSTIGERFRAFFKRSNKELGSQAEKKL